MSSLINQAGNFNTKMRLPITSGSVQPRDQFDQKSPRFSFSPAVARMSVEQTAAQVHALGSQNKKTADVYAKSFRENKITGSRLLTLTKDQLKELKISKLGHRLQILSAIKTLQDDSTSATNRPFTSNSKMMANHHLSKQYVFSNSDDEVVRSHTNGLLFVPVQNNRVAQTEPMMCPSGAEYDGKQCSNYGVGPLLGMICPLYNPQSCLFAGAEDHDNQSSSCGFQPSLGLGVPFFEPQSYKTRYEVTSTVDSVGFGVVGSKEEEGVALPEAAVGLESELNSQDEVKLPEGAVHVVSGQLSYQPVFLNEVVSSAQSTTRQRKPRPSPKKPMSFIVISRATVRTGKSLSSDVVYDLCQGTVVTVNQLKGRRVRILDANGGVIGWASLHTADGYFLIVPFTDDKRKQEIGTKQQWSKKHGDGLNVVGR